MKLLSLWESRRLSGGEGVLINTPRIVGWAKALPVPEARPSRKREGCVFALNSFLSECASITLALFKLSFIERSGGEVIAINGQCHSRQDDSERCDRLNGRATPINLIGNLDLVRNAIARPS